MQLRAVVDRHQQILFYISKDFFTQQQQRTPLAETEPRNIFLNTARGRISIYKGGGQEQKDILGLNKSVTQKKREINALLGRCLGNIIYGPLFPRLFFVSMTHYCAF
jgi:hypothetical protein